MGFYSRWQSTLSGTSESFIYRRDSNYPNQLEVQLINKLHSKEFINVQPTQPVCDLDSDYRRTANTEHIARVPTISNFFTGTLLNTGTLENFTAYSTLTPYRPYYYREYTNISSYVYTETGFPQGSTANLYFNRSSEMYITGTTGADPSITPYIIQSTGSNFVTYPKSLGDNSAIQQYTPFDTNPAFSRIVATGFGWRNYYPLFYWKYNKDSPCGMFNYSSADLFSYNLIKERFAGLTNFNSQYIQTADSSFRYYFDKTNQAEINAAANGLGQASGDDLITRQHFFDNSYSNNDQFLSASINNIIINVSGTIQNGFQSLVEFNTVYIFPLIYHRHTTDGLYLNNELNVTLPWIRS